MNREELKEILKNENTEILKYDNAEDWHKLRKGGIGGSDAGAVLGVNKYRSTVDIYLSKVENKKTEPNDAMLWGTALEPVIREEFKKKHLEEYEVFECDYTFKDGIMLANVDGILFDKNKNEYGILEIKTANQFTAKDWSNGLVPSSYYVQVQHYLAVTGFKFGVIAVLIGGADYREFYVERNENDIKLINEACTDFWNTYIIPKEIPSADGSDAYSKYQLEILEKLDLKNDVVELDEEYDELLEKRFDIQERIKTLDEDLKKINQQVIDVLSKEEAKYAESESFKVSLVRQERTKVDKKAFESENKEIVDKYKELEENYKKPYSTYFIRATRKDV